MLTQPIQQWHHFSEAVELRLRKNKAKPGEGYRYAAQFTGFSRSSSFQTLTFALVSPASPPRYPAHAGERTRRVSGVQPIFGAMEQIARPLSDHIHPDFPEPYESPADGLPGKTSILVILFTSSQGV